MLQIMGVWTLHLFLPHPIPFLRPFPCYHHLPTSCFSPPSLPPLPPSLRSLFPLKRQPLLMIPSHPLLPSPSYSGTPLHTIYFHHHLIVYPFTSQRLHLLIYDFTPLTILPSAPTFFPNVPYICLTLTSILPPPPQFHPSNPYLIQGQLHL